MARNERDKMVDRISALLKKTIENGCTEDEAASAAAKAQELLFKYNLTIDEVLQEDEQGEQFEVVFSEDTFGVQAQQDWKLQFAAMIARYYFCKCVFHGKRGFTFIGREHNVQVARMVDGWLRQNLLAMCHDGAREIKTDDFWSSKDARRARKDYRESFLWGGYSAVRDYLEKQYNEQVEGSQGLVIFDDKAIATAMNERWGKLGTAKIRQQINNRDAYNAGIKGGNTLTQQLGRSVNGSRSAAPGISSGRKALAG